MNKYLRSGQIEKIKTIKQWVDQKMPLQLKVLQPMLDYTFGWLSPELLGTGFSIQTQTDVLMLAKIPFSPTNKDFQNQIHQGLVVNAGFEMIRTILNANLMGHSFQFLKTETNIKKKLIWNSDLILKLNIDPEIFEQQLINFQKNKNAEFEFEIYLQVGDLKKSDLIFYKIEIQKVNLLAQRSS